MTVPFNKPPYTGVEDQHVLAAMRSEKISGDGNYSARCQQWFLEHLGCRKALLTPSCTHALEVAAILIDIQPGDEVIMPSYTFVSTANAFVLRGARIIFIDVRPDTMNMDESCIEAAITPRTKAIVPVHYAGVACEMDTIMDIAYRYGLYVIEDAAQGMMASYKGQRLGSIGHLGAYSFHETKNYTSGGEGGLLIINDERFMDRAEIIREKGTNRSQFFRGAIDKYSWVDVGSSYLPSELQAAYLWGQLQSVDDINSCRKNIWNCYHNAFRALDEQGRVKRPTTPDECIHNAHMYYLKAKNLEERSALINSLMKQNVSAVFHYNPLHSSIAGKRFGTFVGNDRYTTKESERLVRLPMWYGLSEDDREHVIVSIKMFYS